MFNISDKERIAALERQVERLQHNEREARGHTLRLNDSETLSFEAYCGNGEYIYFKGKNKSLQNTFSLHLETKRIKYLCDFLHKIREEMEEKINGSDGKAT